ncbi:helix-turn-helix transcriptional regulator [Streptomyces sp. AV19]|uniref:helix-turn-helix transcriptional regulator n=1 Tax=Streptomyces sp. AV19 TaxID=2793068 RepID=UPI0018FE5753|nr:helix-turn-helix transcriptional regulator [Streptomyces sp. AV19]MBH1938420.1 helix-turn-helix transcriptional regulator [Streptomyces sp. AV19]MDG4535069.1 helix-turn-helix transcriptional regulator [Streptomyces sp. AV19]
MPGAIGPAVVGNAERERRAGQHGREWPQDGPPATGAGVEVVTGAQAVTHRLTRLRLGAVEEVCALVRNRPWVDTGDARGVRHRTVVDRRVRPAPVDRAGAHLVRIAERVPAELFLADRRDGLLVLTGPDAEPAALAVGPGELLDSLVLLFEALWREARPLWPAGGHVTAALPSAGPDATDLAVLSLLLSGLTDASVAKQLGLGLRTVQRRVKRLMELAGVTTRLQLGWIAAERGWTAARR